MSESARILVVDDIEDNRHLLTRRLAREGYTNVATAADGEEALLLLMKESFDLVLLDVMMPRCDGYEVLQRLKSAGRLHELPVIMISALTEMESVVRCIELGAVDYLSKPFNATLLKARVGASIEKKKLRDEVTRQLRRLEEEMDAARLLQMSMVPAVFPAPTPQRPVEIAAAMRAAREVGGDLYDFFFAADGKLCFLIGDVSGKGMPAALFMARTKTLVRFVTNLLAELQGVTPAPAEVIRRVNAALCEDNDTNMFVTLFLGILDPRTGVIQFCNAGHNPPYRLGAAPVAIEGGSGLAIGILDDAPYVNAEIEVGRGETIFLFTDGITEAYGPDDALYGTAPLEAALSQSSGLPLVELIAEIVARVERFADGAPQSDDITALAIRRVNPA